MLGGATLDVGGGVLEVASVGLATPVVVPVEVVGTGAIVYGGSLIVYMSDENKDKPDNEGGSREKHDSKLEEDKAQLEGIEKAQEQAKKSGEGKQNKIYSVEKSKQRLKNDLKNIKSLDDLE